MKEHISPGKGKIIIYTAEEYVKTDQTPNTPSAGYVIQAFPSSELNIEPKWGSYFFPEAKSEADALGDLRSRPDKEDWVEKILKTIKM